MLDRDLAVLYDVSTFNLNKAVKRNFTRFPPDFMFQLKAAEYEALRFQTGILKRGQHAKYLPHVFTQEGIAMLSGVLRSERAILVNIAIMRAFVRFRQILASHHELALHLRKLDKRVGDHDDHIRSIFETLHHFMTSPKRKTRIGFKTES
jgi:hypothetical protein